MYNCHSLDSTSLIPPYACSFSNGTQNQPMFPVVTTFNLIPIASKRGQAHVLAVATEQGTVDLLDTSKRARDWDPGSPSSLVECFFLIQSTEPPRTTLQIHDNGIFDIQWSTSDRLFATASGDRTVAIVDPKSFSGSALHVLDAGRAGTIKCLNWDPTSDNLLVSGSRDGRICLWDLRSQHRESSERWRPVLEIPYAHEKVPGKPTKNGRAVIKSRSITSVAFQPECSDQVLSTGSGDG